MKLFLCAVFDISIDGEICTLTMLDRETTASYNLVIEVSDSPENARTALSNVTITINDVNDNSPTFTAGAVLSPDPVLILEVRRRWRNCEVANT